MTLVSLQAGLVAKSIAFCNKVHAHSAVKPVSLEEVSVIQTLQNDKHC